MFLKRIWNKLFGRGVAKDVAPHYQERPLIVERALKPLKLRSEFRVSRYDYQYLNEEGIKKKLISELVNSKDFNNVFDFAMQETPEGFLFSTQLIVYNANK